MRAAQCMLALREWVDWRAIMDWLRGLVYRQPQNGPVYIGRSNIPVPFQDVRASPLLPMLSAYGATRCTQACV